MTSATLSIDVCETPRYSKLFDSCGSSTIKLSRREDVDLGQCEVEELIELHGDESSTLRLRMELTDILCGRSHGSATLAIGGFFRDDDELDSSAWRGVFAPPRPRRKLFSEVIVFETATLRRWTPGAVMYDGPNESEYE